MFSMKQRTYLSQRDKVQTSLIKLAAANEELAAANEKVAAANENLADVKEKLAGAKEKLKVCTCLFLHYIMMLCYISVSTGLSICMFVNVSSVHIVKWLQV